MVTFFSRHTVEDGPLQHLTDALRELKLSLLSLGAAYGPDV
jgi:hypothetical protein